MVLALDVYSVVLRVRTGWRRRRVRIRPSSERESSHLWHV